MANNIKHQLFSGVFYTALAKYSGIIISLVVAGILARLLSPDDFGVVAIATVIIAFFNLFTDMGISPAIVQHKSLTKEELSDIFSFTVWTGIGISILFFAASWLIADYYESGILRTLCQLLSVNLFFASANIVPGALFYRNKEFKFIAVRSFIIQIAGGQHLVDRVLEFGQFVDFALCGLVRCHFNGFGHFFVELVFFAHHVSFRGTPAVRPVCRRRSRLVT